MFNKVNTKFFIVAFLSIFINSTYALKLDVAYSADNILGFWFNETNTSIIAIQKNVKSNKYFGKIIWLKEPKYKDGTVKRDKKNPDLDLRKRPLYKLTILKDFIYGKRNSWQGGTIYDPESGNSYSCVIKMKKPGELDVRGFVGFSIFGRSTTWTKVSAEEVKSLIS